MDKKLKFSVILISAFLISGCAQQSKDKKEVPVAPEEYISQEEVKGDEMTQKENTLPPPEMQINTSKTYKAVLSTTEGVITISLHTDKTPITVNNFVYLARKGFYNNTIFHRIIKDFMIQGGDPKGDGTGGPGYKFDDEPFEGEYKRGIAAMANAGPNTNGSQFFIMHKDYALPKNYVIFGEVASGIEAVDKIAEASVKESAMGENSTPANPVTIESVEILEE